MNIEAKRSWITKKPIYQVMVKDNYSKDLRISNFKNIERRIPRIAEHNIGTIWLCGVLQNGAEIGSEFKRGVAPFALTDPYRIEDRYGTKHELISLIKTIHGYGMKVISDSILNHVSRISPLLLSHPEWFLKHDSGWIRSGTDRNGSHEFADTAQFDFLNPKVKDYLLGSADLMHEVGFDGLRIDAAPALLKRIMKANWYRGRENQVDDRYPVDLLQEVISRYKSLNPDAEFLAETMDPFTHNEIWNCGSDLVQDPNFPYLIFDAFKCGATADDLENYFRAMSWSHGPHSAFSTVHNIDGHDIRDVYFNNYTIEKLRYFDSAEKKAATALMVTLPGVPLFYNGEIEALIGCSYNRYAESFIDYNNVDTDMAKFYHALSNLWSRPLFRSGKLIHLQTHSSWDFDVRGFAREYKGQKAVVAVNFSNRVNDSGKGWRNFDVSPLLSPDINKYRFQNLMDKNMSTIMTTEELKRNGFPVGLGPKETQIFEIFPCQD
jgi:glycosidase